ncbi:MAG: acetate--CoA ligase family protein [Bacteroidota bacterium]|nr:acetate--CoA ligase family protein [Bacteroidota bacterium]MDP4232483.1 acetate--CoA ligase family protein [Bacteroidota bacterium]MDP4241618.1 acetate--CoA ligase family protein [Bacteroidota bacterium]MDP4286362.1 acetate--CoA ligase family protein [Bacteroidota bacterium]
MTTEPTPGAILEGIATIDAQTSGLTPPSPLLLHPLDVFFHPRTIAIIGASERTGSPGEAITTNLFARAGSGYEVFAVNPVHKMVGGHPAYAHIAEVPASVDLAIIVTPAATVADLISECVKAGVRGAIVISAGFRESGAAGKALELEILNRIRDTHLRVIGPNCIGVMNPVSGLNATFARKAALPGSVAFISQSGALCTAILDWSLSEALGFSAFVSVGSMLDVGWGDLIDYLGDDPATESIVIYMESIGDAPSFLEAARKVALRKPIIVIKAGRTAAAAKAAASHTGAMTGSDDVLDAAFRRAGVLRIDWIGDVFHIAEVLAKQPRPTGRRLAIVTNAGGPGVLAADALMEGGGELAQLSSETMRKLDEMLPPAWSHGNPIDILADSSEATFERAVELALNDPGTDGVLAMTAPLVAARPINLAKSISKLSTLGKPLIASFMGGSDVSDADGFMSRGGIPTFAFPDDAARVFNYMWKFGENLKTLESSEITENQRVARQSSIIDRVRSEGRTILNEVESKQLLAEYDIPVTQTIAAVTPEEAVMAARQIGFPVVAKLLSKTITHKSDVGGVKLDLETEDQVRQAFEDIRAGVIAGHSATDFDGISIQPMVDRDGYELILGSSIDPQFGPVILFGAGGVFAEVMKDTALELPPLNQAIARRLIERTRIWGALKGTRGKQPIDVIALESLLVRFSQLIIEQPWIAEVDINPLLASSKGCLALDARVLLHGPNTIVENLPRAAMMSQSRCAAAITL